MKVFVLIGLVVVSRAQFMPNFYGTSPGGSSVPGLFPVLSGNDNKNNPSSGGWPFYQQQPGFINPQQAGFNPATSPGNNLRQGDQQQQQQQPFNPFGNFFGGFPGFSNPWFNPQQQQQKQAPSQNQQPYYGNPYGQQPYRPYEYQNPQQQQPQQQQVPAANPSSYSPSPAAQAPVQQQPQPSPYQNPAPAQQQQQPPAPAPVPQQQPGQTYSPQNSWNPAPASNNPVAPAGTPNQYPAKYDNEGAYRPDTYQPGSVNQPSTLNVNGEPYGQQQQQRLPSQQEHQTQPEAEFTGDVRNNGPAKDVGQTSQQLLPVAGSAPGEGWVYPDA